MCIQLFAYNSHPNYTLIMAANRDEFYDRPTSKAEFWDDAPHVLAGRDLKIGGTWMGVTKSGKFAAVTNYRDPKNIDPDATSRGMLVSKYLLENITPEVYLSDLENGEDTYNGFNLLMGSCSDLYYYSNRENIIRKLGNGIYGLSNSLLDIPWPKITTGKNSLKNIIENNKYIDPEDLLKILKNNTKAADSLLPETGISIELERMLSSIYISDDKYGTRSSTVILIKKTGELTFVERTFAESKKNMTPPQTKTFSFQINYPHQRWGYE